jgi:hypothetical protein
VQAEVWLAAVAAIVASVGSKSIVTGPGAGVWMCVIPVAVGLRQMPVASTDQ